MQEGSALPPCPAPRLQPRWDPTAAPRREPRAGARSCARALRTALPLPRAPRNCAQRCPLAAAPHAHVSVPRTPTRTRRQRRGRTAPSRWEAKRGAQEDKKRGKSIVSRLPSLPLRYAGHKSPRPAAYLRALQIEQRRQPPADPSEQKVHGCRRTPRSGARRAPPRRRRPAAAAAPPRSRPRLLRARRRLLGCRQPGATKGCGIRGIPLRGLRFHPSISPALRRPPLLLSVGAPPGRAQAPRPPCRRPAPAAGQSELHSGARPRRSPRVGAGRHPRRARSDSRTHSKVCAETFNASLFLRSLFAAAASGGSPSRGRLPGRKGLIPPPLGPTPLRKSGWWWRKGRTERFPPVLSVTVSPSLCPPLKKKIRIVIYGKKKSKLDREGGNWGVGRLCRKGRKKNPSGSKYRWGKNKLNERIKQGGKLAAGPGARGGLLPWRAVPRRRGVRSSPLARRQPRSAHSSGGSAQRQPHRPPLVSTLQLSTAATGRDAPASPTSSAMARPPPRLPPRLSGPAVPHARAVAPRLAHFESSSLPCFLAAPSAVPMDTCSGQNSLCPWELFQSPAEPFGERGGGGQTVITPII